MASVYWGQHPDVGLPGHVGYNELSTFREMDGSLNCTEHM